METKDFKKLFKDIEPHKQNIWDALCIAATAEQTGRKT